MVGWLVMARAQSTRLHFVASAMSRPFAAALQPPRVVEVSGQRLSHDCLGWERPVSKKVAAFGYCDDGGGRGGGDGGGGGGGGGLRNVGLLCMVVAAADFEVADRWHCLWLSYGGRQAVCAQGRVATDKTQPTGGGGER